MKKLGFWNKLDFESHIQANHMPILSRITWEKDLVEQNTYS